MDTSGLYNEIMRTPMHNLINVKRYAGVQLLREESVADHVWQMVAGALNLVPLLNRIENNINIKEVIYRIVIHDLDESISFDIPRPFKYHSKRIHDAIESTNQSLMKEHYPNELINSINSAKDQSREGMIVRILDLIQTWMKIENEVMMGNRIIITELRNMFPLISELQEAVTRCDFTEDQLKTLNQMMVIWKQEVLDVRESLS